MRQPPEDREWFTGWIDYEREQAGPGPVLDFLPVIMARLAGPWRPTDSKEKP